MKLIPFERFTIDTQLKKDEVKARLEKRIGPNKANNFQRIDQNYFYGGLSGDKFKIYPILDHRNSWKPFLYGTIIGTDKGTKISVIMRPNLIILLVTLTMIFGALLTNELVPLIESKFLEIVLPVMFPIVLYVICTTAFYSDTEMCKDYLVEITDGQIK
jgi:hypothetical protein